MEEVNPTDPPNNPDQPQTLKRVLLDEPLDRLRQAVTFQQKLAQAAPKKVGTPTFAAKDSKQGSLMGLLKSGVNWAKLIWSVAGGSTPLSPVQRSPNYFQAHGVLPPAPPCEKLPFGELTVGEVFFTMTDEDDKSLKKIAEAGTAYHLVKTPIVPPKLLGDKDGDSPTTISAFAWHKYLQKFAIAKGNVVYTYNVNLEEWSHIKMQHELQRNITCMEWKPFAGNTLAVGHGVFLWYILARGPETAIQKGNLRILKDTHAYFKVLPFPRSSPVTSLAWSPRGRYLAIGSIDSPSVLMWDSFDDTLKTLEPAWFGGVTTLSWSPNGDYLFAGYTNDAASGSSSWKIWETMTWTVQGFLQDHGCKTVSWSKNSNFLALSCREESVLHFIHLPSSPPSLDPKYYGKCTLDKFEATNKETFSVCGTIAEVVWDPTGSRIAVSFEDTPLVALFLVYPETLSVQPLGFFRGPPNCGTPKHLKFCPVFPRGALLSMCWDNGKVSLCPMYFNQEPQ